MADINKELCCASSAMSQRCSNCQDSCSCSEGCQCSSVQLQAKPCAGNDAKQSCGTVCRCSQSCPCRNNGCSTKALESNLCDSGTKQAVASCTMPGNCNCSKGSVGKL